METQLNALIVRSEIPEAIIVLKPEVLETINTVVALVDDQRVEDILDLACADDLHLRGRQLLKTIETERKLIKAPVLALGDAIDTAAKGASNRLTVSIGALATKIMTFQRKQEDDRRAAEAEVRRQQEEYDRKVREESERARKAQDEAAKMGRVVRPLPPARPIVEPPRPLPVAPVVKSSAVTMRKDQKLVIDDASAIPYEIGGVVLLAPIESAILGLLKAKATVPGCRIVEVETPVGKRQ